MKSLRNSLSRTLPLLMGSALLSTPFALHAQTYTTTKVKVYEYAAKFICEPGLIAETTVQQTASTVTSNVNVHNPHFDHVYFYVKLVDAWGQIHGPYQKYLPADGAMSFSCDAFFNGTDTFTLSVGSSFEGFLVVLGLDTLDVVGVHEVASRGYTQDLDIVPVQPTLQTITSSKWNWFISQTPDAP